MKEVQGKFILFDTTAFASWLSALRVTRKINLIQIHHTWKPSYSDFKKNNQFALLKGMEQAHLERGFAEIAQNLTVFPDGTVASCRSFNTIPAGIKGANTNGICIENVGNFDVGHDAMTQAHKDCIVKVGALLCRQFHLTPNSNTIVYHHWYDLTTGVRTNGTGNTKTCPGTNFFGGNSVSSEESGFIPAVSAELTALNGTTKATAPASAPAKKRKQPAGGS